MTTGETDKKEQVVGVRVKREGESFRFFLTTITLCPGDLVVVETDQGPALGEVASPPQPCGQAEPPALPQVLRRADDDDLHTLAENRRLEGEAKDFCIERVKLRGLPMKVIDVECLFDRSKVIFYFTAENRVDFRELVKDLVQRFRTRIELRQIGARQEARLVRGLGICGREVCCARALQNLDRVTVKMAKEQGMSLNPEKISGLCGRLMCCLAYEYEVYLDLRKDMPKCGKTITTPQGRGKVIRQNILNRELVVALESGREVTLPLDELKN
ncbi:MAG TPA: stage 0 sporulation family protein [Syntrophales bacterium]|nr:stage 0 sporulation family protein [Syntrophales bacterium]HOO00702.1 stage 0 sporulation family protein [Syntrophales bacterium]HPQ06824.1 stage 0 sporulation family protein [Syntrophales bacterium]HRS87055.1 stage 0 sporulation family protein [Syntrophales bacterium]HRV42704.1 stage 0 sporulation family protein [Syntrophales bacterium]